MEREHLKRIQAGIASLAIKVIGGGLIGGGALALGASVLNASAAAPDGNPVAAIHPSKAPTGAGSLAIQPYQRELAGIVADMLQAYHYEKRAIDDRVSSVWFDNYIDGLDYNRMVFLRSDVEEFERHRKSLDDELFASPPKLDTALAIHARYRQRMRERAEYAHALLSKPLDLTDAESMVPDRHKADLPWPETTEQANDLWRKRMEDEVIDGLLVGRDTEAEIREQLVQALRSHAAVPRRHRVHRRARDVVRRPDPRLRPPQHVVQARDQRQLRHRHHQLGRGHRRVVGAEGTTTPPSSR